MLVTDSTPARTSRWSGDLSGRSARNLPDTERLSYHWLWEKFGRYFDGLGV